MNTTIISNIIKEFIIHYINYIIKAQFAKKNKLLINFQELKKKDETNLIEKNRYC